MQVLDFVTIRLFLAIARAGSLGEAARREHIAVSAVSRRINDLEAELGVRLLRRLPRGVELTAAGRLFVQHGETLLAQARAMTDAMRGFPEGARGEVRLVSTSAGIAGPLPEILQAFRAELPEVELVLREGYSREGVEMVRDGEVDLAIVADNVPHSGLASRFFCADPIWVVTPAGHPLVAGRDPDQPVPFAEAARYDIVVLHEGGVLDDLFLAAAERAGVTLRRSFSVNRMSSLRRMVEAGHGIGFLRESGARPFLGQMRLGGAPIADPWARRALSVVHRADTPLAGPVRGLLDRLAPPDAAAPAPPGARPA